MLFDVCSNSLNAGDSGTRPLRGKRKRAIDEDRWLLNPSSSEDKDANVTEPSGNPTSSETALRTREQQALGTSDIGIESPKQRSPKQTEQNNAKPMLSGPPLPIKKKRSVRSQPEARSKADVPVSVVARSGKLSLEGLYFSTTNHIKTSVSISHTSFSGNFDCPLPYSCHLL